MKIIEAMKKIKDLQRKRSDIRQLIANHHADYDIEEAKYPDQMGTVRGWLQSNFDIGQEILSLRIRIQKTNLATMVPIELDGKVVTRCIAEWVHRRRDLAKADLDDWRVLNDKNLAPVNKLMSTSGDVREVKIRRYYDVKEKDEKVNAYQSEPTIIDGKLEVVNAITDLLE